MFTNCCYECHISRKAGHSRRRVIQIKSMFNAFTPEFLKWSLQSLNLEKSIDANKDFSLNKNGMANSVDPDETGCYEPSHIKYLFLSPGLKRVKITLC